MGISENLLEWCVAPCRKWDKSDTFYNKLGIYTYKLTKMCIPCWPDISNLMEKLRSLLCSKKSLFHAKLSWVYIAMHSVLDTWQESCIEVYSIKRKTSFSYCYQTSVVDTHPFLNPRVKWDWERESYEKEPTITCFLWSIKSSSYTPWGGRN